jgi:tRNA-uridine 2-sulfurtransferase
MRALALLSGGLDSILAAKVVQRAVCEVIGVKFDMPFYIRSAKPLPDIGIEVRYADISAEFLVMMGNPRYGFGSNMNPCIDCKILMLSKAKALLEPWGAHFLVTGEVLGQRPMSQQRQSLDLIARRAGVEGLLLRPLSGKLLPATLAETQGWISRDKLLSFNGRSRKPQFALAEELGLTQYAQPAGGCLLTDPSFARRIKDLRERNALTLENARLLKTGRHFRVSAQAKLVVGRNEKESLALEAQALPGDWLFLPDAETAGPSALGRGSFGEEEIALAAGIVRSYCDERAGARIEIVCRHLPSEEMRLEAQKVSEDVVERQRI